MAGDLPMCHKAFGPATEYGLRTTNPFLHLDVNKGSTARIALLILHLVARWPVIAWIIPVVIDSPMCGWFWRTVSITLLSSSTVMELAIWLCSPHSVLLRHRVWWEMPNSRAIWTHENDISERKSTCSMLNTEVGLPTCFVSRVDGLWDGWTESIPVFLPKGMI